MLFNKKIIVPLLGILAVVFAILSYRRGMHADVNGDYYIYWVTGRNFITGLKLYTPGLTDGGFTYPPFAAMLFSLFAVFPFHTSAFLFTYFINFGLWVVSFYLIKQIMALLYPGANLQLPLLLSLLLSIPFYWHNFMWMNANLPVFCFTLLGIKNYICKKFTLSYLFFLAGAFFKITPVIFLLFAAIKRGPKAWPKIIMLTVPFIIVPMLLRGFNTGMQDWGNYYQAFVAPFSKGQIDENIISLGIPAMLTKLNNGNTGIGYAPVLHLSAAALKVAILIIQVTLFTAVTIKITYDTYILHNKAFAAADLALIFLITLLLPGRVWAHHHVCAGFIFTYLFFIIRNNKPLLIVTILLCFVMSIITRADIGQGMTDLLRHYTYITWVMIYVTILIVWFGYFKKPMAQG